MPAIPTPLREDLDSRHDVIVALKQCVEMLMGTVGRQPVARTFVQEEMPKAYNVGDFWLQPSKNYLSAWTGNTWTLLNGGP
jgi:hypothetical protein